MAMKIYRAHLKALNEIAVLGKDETIIINEKEEVD